MVNSMCQFGAQIDSQTLFWNVSVKKFLDEFNIEISRFRVKQITLHNVGGVLIQLTENLNRTQTDLL